MSRVMQSQRAEVHCGDSLNVLRMLNSNSVHAVVTDPPYCSGGLHASARSASPEKKYISQGAKVSYGHYHGDSKDQRSFTSWAAEWLSECYRITHDDAFLAVFIDWRQLPALSDAIQWAGWTWKGLVPWNKVNGRPQRGWFRGQCEYVLVATKGIGITDKNEYAQGFIYETAVAPAMRRHQAEKPKVVLESIIKLLPPDCTLIDPFMGSGAIGEVAIRMGHRFIGIEMDEQYCTKAFDSLSALLPT